MKAVYFLFIAVELFQNLQLHRCRLSPWFLIVNIYDSDVLQDSGA